MLAFPYQHLWKRPAPSTAPCIRL